MARYNPFEAYIEPLDPAEEYRLLPLALRRRMMWDMIGSKMVSDPEAFGENPASSDVLDLEYRDMVMRQQAMEAFGPNVDMACSIATITAVKALSVMNPDMKDLSEDDMEKLTEEHRQVATMVTKAVLGNMLATRMIHTGAHG